MLQVLLAMYQYFYQTSPGLKFLGEEYLKPYLAGVAKFKLLFGYHWIVDKIYGITHDSLIMRPYGTFSHPNVFGAYMFFSCLLSYYLLIVSRETKKRVLISIVIFFQILGIFLSFSRVAICAWIIATFVWFVGLFIMKLKRKDRAVVEYWARIKTLIKITVSSLVISLVLFYPQYLERTGVVSYGTSNQEAISDRLLFQNISLRMIKQHPLTGVGYLNFVNQMENYSKTKLQDYQLQPVHNVYLLIAAESGLPALILFLLFVGLIVYKAIRNKALNPLSLVLLSIFIGFLFINLFDHYLWTIQQGRLMFFTVAGLLVASVSLNNRGEKEMAVADNS
jgi:O-antigen ligase